MQTKRQKYTSSHIGIVSLLCVLSFPGYPADSMGPLRVHPENPNYFQNPATGEVVYLTGSHTWANFQDRGVKGKTPEFDFEEYLSFLQEHNHNFIRLWAWEHAHWMQFAKPDEAIRYEPMRYARTGPGMALDGDPKFDLTQFNQDYFKRLRNRVERARGRGFYVSVMLFQGFSIEQKGTKGVDPKKGNPWDGHPFHRENNINGVDGDPNRNGEGEETHTLAIPEITRLHEAYICKVIDTLNDLDNLLWEISNESHGGSTQWQYHMIEFIHNYEKPKPLQHPVGMTFQWDKTNSGSNENLFNSPAEWISPNSDGGYRDNPPPAEGRKVILTNTDHLWGIGGSPEWVWKSFTRGLNPIFMDLYKDVRFDVLKEKDKGWESIRRAMGHTMHFAHRINLAKTKPAGSLSSTGYCLASSGNEYLIYQQNGGKSFTVEVVDGSYTIEWFNPTNGTSIHAGKRDIAGNTAFKPPFGDSAVLYLSKSE